ncbi:MFS transporter [Glacieibacterium megasporae]|uniref:MFS transporter n=1 Tax=Glacieibacterium megasporae TaxID=2835787 RepID=UPI001C1E6BC4|nr:MFS transporter [Polymorphobacter megasporae]UAJ10587.1 MFS transporter [Polymorphobacter megasporae]
MSEIDVAPTAVPDVTVAAWPAVWSLMFGVCGLIAAEFLPAGLLTPMARDLAVSEALAGQAVTATAVVSFFAALFAPSTTRRFDRRFVLFAFTALLIASDLLVAAAPNLPLLLLARALLGFALGGFWSMAAAVTIRLVPAVMVPRALAVVFSGISVATIVAVPLGSYLGGVYGWRTVFILAAAFGVLTLLIQVVALPPLAVRGVARLGTLLHVLRRRGIGAGVICIVLVYAGHFGLFTFLRPFLETEGGFHGERIAIVLTVFGLANLAGTVFASVLLERSLRLPLTLTTMLLGSAALALAVTPTPPAAVTIGLVAVWGIAYGGIPVSWSTWIAQAVPDETESGGGLIVAAVQLAITIGAAGGGLIFAAAGVKEVFVIAGLLTLTTSVAVYASMSGPRMPVK